MGVRENLGRAGLRTQRSCLASSGLLNLPEPQFPAPRGAASAQARSPPCPDPLWKSPRSRPCALCNRDVRRRALSAMSGGELIRDHASVPAGSPLLGLWFGSDLPVILHAFAPTLLPSS